MKKINNFLFLITALYASRSCLYCLAISGTSGSLRSKDLFRKSLDRRMKNLTSGFGSHNNEQIDNKTFDIVNAGDQLLRKISRQIAPFELIFGW